jgi:hypothetical protein
MNYIHQLKSELAAAHATLAAKEQIVRDFLAHLATSKFSGEDPDGRRKDWIAVADVRAWLALLLAVPD